jgi:glutamyl-tRNA synthetase
MNDAKVRVRFAPSPTGLLHVGGARTALFNWFFARHTGGAFVLRFEDTDVARSYVEAERDLIEDLHWLGLDWDEGPDIGGPFAPYRQSERLGLYREIADAVVSSGKAYKCYCTDSELALRRKAAVDAGGPPHYDGRCRNLSPKDVGLLEAEGRQPSIRFLVQYDEVVLEDVVRGEVSFKGGMVGDFIMLRADGMPTYNFACVVDDAKMEISHVIRGEEHLSNTLRQLLIYEHLGIKPPIFAHIPLVLAPDRSKLSKRHGATSVGEMRRLGYPSEAIVNHLSLLGWSPGDGREVMSRGEIRDSFSLERVSSSPSIFDTDKLEWITAQHVKRMDVGEVVRGMAPFLGAAGAGAAEPGLVVRAAAALRETGKRFPQLAEDAMIFLRTDEPLSPDLLERLRAPSAPRAIAAFRTALSGLCCPDKAAVSALLARLVAETGMKKGELFMPLRIALTGATKGPEIPVVVEVLGKDRALGLLERALEALAGS